MTAFRDENGPLCRTDFDSEIKYFRRAFFASRRSVLLGERCGEGRRRRSALCPFSFLFPPRTIPKFFYSNGRSHVLVQKVCLPLHLCCSICSFLSLSFFLCFLQPPPIIGFVNVSILSFIRCIYYCLCRR